MRLEVFDVIDDALGILNANQELYQHCAELLKRRFEEQFPPLCECCLNVVTRVKEQKSLKEKIIRKKMYSRYGNGAAVMQNLSDVVGVRLECRFIKDEAEVFTVLRSLYTIQKGGYYYCPDMPDVGLSLAGPQPQYQRNGADIYRIDGICGLPGGSVRFELQIKSLVRVFWDEIEHKIVYKNNSYRLIDDFLQNLMLSINDNLVSIDRQLMLIYEQMQQHEDADAYIREGNAKRLLAKAINDTLYKKMDEEMGFTINFGQPCEVLADFALSSRMHDSEAEKLSGMEVMVMLLYRIREMKLDMKSALELERPLRCGDGFGRVISETLSRVMNEDFEWNLFFRMLFIMEPSNNAGDMEFFISYLRNELSANSSGSGAVHTLALEALLECVAQGFARRPDISFIAKESLLELSQRINAYLEQIVQAVDTPEQWEQYRSHFIAEAGERLNLRT